MRPSTITMLVVCALSLTPSRTWADDAVRLVGEYGAPSRLDVQGCDKFQPQAVKKALLRKKNVVLAGHRLAPLVDYLFVLQQEALVGYLHEGFLHARINPRIESSNNRIVLSIEEGNHYSSGEIRVIGAKNLNVEELIQRLTHPYPPDSAVTEQFHQVQGKTLVTWLDRDGKTCKMKDAIWIQGDPAPFSQRDRKTLTEKTQKALHDLGYEFARFSLTVAPDELQATADLAIQIIDEGQPANINGVEIVGNEKNSREQVLQYLQLSAGALLTRGERTKLSHKLWESGRFYEHRIVSFPSIGREGIDLKIELHEYPLAPSLNEPFSKEEQTLLKCRHWLAQQDEDGKEFVLTIYNKNTDNSWELIISPKHGILGWTAPGKHGDKLPDQFHAIVYSDRLIGVYSSQQQTKLVLPAFDVRLNGSFGVRFNPEVEGDTSSRFRLNFGFGFNSLSQEELKAPFRLALNFSPLAFVAMVHERNAKISWQEHWLIGDSDHEHFKIDSRNGELIEYRLIDQDGIQVQLSTHTGMFDKRLSQIHRATDFYPNDYYLPAQPVTSIVGFICDFEPLLEIGFVRRALGRQGFDDISLHLLGKLTRLGLLEPLDRFVMINISEPSGNFAIPMDQKKNQKKNQDLINVIALLTMQLSDQWFPEGSWPAVLSRETAFILLGNTKHTALGLKQLAISEETGPLGCLALSHWSGRFAPRASVLFAQLGITKLNLTDFQNDYRILLNEQYQLSKLLLHASQILQKLDKDEIQALSVGLSDENALLLQDFCRLLRKHRDLPISEVTPMALDDVWKTHLRHRMKSALREFLPQENAANN